MPMLLAAARTLATFLFVLLTFVAMKIGYNYVVRGYIDLRVAALWELVVLPVGITFVVGIICWLQRRRLRRIYGTPAKAGTAAPSLQDRITQ